MNQQRVPDSSGLPLRAAVMVLLFLAVGFLLLGLNALFSGGGSSNQSTAVVSAPATTTTTTTPPPAPKAAVWVYNIGTTTGLAGDTAQQLKDAGWSAEAIQQDLDPAPPGVTGTTVYYSDAPGDKESAEEVARILKTPPPLPRTPELQGVQPGVVVIVT
ncbi:MAG TPA: LytR C-terminal domain-containing protein [Mycobacterium sp.]|jgi:hypothetical protein